MLTSWKIGRVAGINLHLHPTFLLLLAIFAARGGLDAAAMVAAVFGCVLLHELGHALTARMYGIRTRDITLSIIGGVARLERMPRSPGAELLITLAGPLVNVCIAATIAASLMAASAFAPFASEGSLGAFAGQLLVINVVLAVFNMIPAFPMDGGRILRALLSRPLGRYRATEIAAGVGRVLAVSLPLAAMFYGVFHWEQLLLAAFVFFAGANELAQVRAEDRDDHGSGGGDGLHLAPPGYRWVSRGQGQWQLAPIVVPGWGPRR